MIDYQYLAGLIDGDGYIYVCLEESLKKYPRSRVSIFITSKDKWFLEELRNRIGGGGVYAAKPKGLITIRGVRGKEYEFNPSYNLIINKKEIVHNILKSILPHSILKKEKVLEALKKFEQ